MNHTLCVIGEALIDFIPEQKGMQLKEVSSFQRIAGGAPLNVAAAYAKLGLSSKLVTQLGDDAFGHYILDVCQEYKIDTSAVSLSAQFETSLAFVSLGANGEREFKFYREHCADLQLEPHNISDEILNDCSFLHFGSVALRSTQMRNSHDKLIRLAQDQNIPISFDPNIRLSLWDDEQKLKDIVHRYLKVANIIKISDDELEFLCGHQDIERFANQMFLEQCTLVLYTKGGRGAEVYLPRQSISCAGYPVTVMDTTGAGDSFVGSFLYGIASKGISLLAPDLELLKECLEFANCYAAHTTTKLGGMEAMGTLTQIHQFYEKLEEERK